MSSLASSALALLRRSLQAATLIVALAVLGGCAAPQATSRGAEPDAPAPTLTALGAAAVQAGVPPSPTAASPRTATPSPRAVASPSPATSSASPGPTSVYGCPPGPCPSSLEYAVNGCDCAGQSYDNSRVTAQFCCKDGFSDSECAEALQLQTRAESVFGATAGEVESRLVTVKLQGWSAQVHEKAAAAFRQAAAAIENMGYRIREPVQSYSRRDVRGHEVLSYHAFGIAVDVNPSTNPACGMTRWCRCNNDLVTDMPPDFVQAFKDAGFEWGGDWADHPDPMHFEWAGWR